MHASSLQVESRRRLNPAICLKFQAHKVGLALSFALLCLLSLLCPALAVGNCSSVAPLTMFHNNAYVQVTGAAATMGPLDANGLPVANTSFVLSIDAIVERARTTTFLNGTLLPDGPDCVFPNPYATLNYLDCFLLGTACFSDPFMPPSSSSCEGSSGKACGQVLQAVRFQNMDCWQEIKNDTLGGFHRQSIVAHFSNASSDFQLQAAYYILDGDYDEYPLLGDNSIVFPYRDGALKVEYLLNNWSWQGPSDAGFDPDLGINNLSATTLWFNTTFQSPAGSVELAAWNHSRSFDYYSSDKSLNMSLEFMTDFIYDDVNPLLLSGYPFSSPLIPLLSREISFNWYVSLCKWNLGHWTNLTYDPTMALLFNAPSEGTPSVPSGAGTKPYVIPVAAGVSVSCVVALVITGTLLIRFNKKFMPPGMLDAPTDTI